MATYLELYPSSIEEGTGLISQLSKRTGIPWKILAPEEIADIERAYCVRSGFKTISSTFTMANDDAKARILTTLFAQRWTRLWNNFALEYNVLDAYIVREKGSRKVDTSDNKVIKHGHALSELSTDGGTVDTQTSANNNTVDSIYGFNSSSSVPADSATESNQTTGKETRNLESSRNLTNSGQDEKDTKGSEETEYAYEKTGNIGYTSPQTLIKQEFEIWKEPFFNQVFDDIDSFITIQVYEV